MRADIHTHAFHPKIAHKVLSYLEDHYGIPPVGNGIVRDLAARIKDAGLDMAATHTAATGPAQVIPANNWAIVMNKRPDIKAFGTLHPDYPGWEKELERLKDAGIRGLKFHADFQGFRLNDPSFLRIMEHLDESWLLMFHVGDDLPPDENPSCPMKMARLVKDFPNLRMIAAHLGGYLHWQLALENLAGLDVYLDTSSSLSFIDPSVLAAILDKHPRERLLFGSDYPLFDPAAEIRQLESVAGLGENEIEDLLKGTGQLLAGLGD